jgi:alkylation response protein AidB-like acyl-CoA dehydrogenase
VDFDDTPEEAAFRAEARAWLAEHAKPRPPGGRRTPMLTDAYSEAEREHVRAAKAWQATLYDEGWAGITWPREHGGRGGTPIQQIIYDQEAAHFDVPPGVFAQGIGMAGPTLIAFGTPEQQRRYLPPMLRGDEVWCQLFSEPGAGSDLAGLTTAAVWDGDDWVINGQKVWTSSAHFSDWGILLARTDPHAPKHRGITYFLLDMKTPGVEVRPLRQITGAAHFNEVFLTEVRIPDANRVGNAGDGWRVAMTTLTNERTLIGAAAAGRYEALIGLARDTGRNADPAVRQELARIYTSQALITYLGWRTLTALSQGRPLGPESSLAKLALADLVARGGNLAVGLRGPAGTITGEGDDHYWTDQFLGQWSTRIGGGTEQVQRSILGERILGLPRELRP